MNAIWCAFHALDYQRIMGHVPLCPLDPGLRKMYPLDPLDPGLKIMDTSLAYKWNSTLDICSAIINNTLIYNIKYKYDIKYDMIYKI